MHDQARTWLQSTRSTIPDTGKVLEIGSYNHNGTCRDYYQSAERTYVGVDIIPGNGVDVVGDVNDKQFCDFLISQYGTFQTIMSTETLEHTPAKSLLFSMMSLLDTDAPSCRLVLTCANKARPEHSYDGGLLKDGEYYGNVSEQEIIEWVREYANSFGINRTHSIIYNIPTAADQMDTYAHVEFIRK